MRIYIYEPHKRWEYCGGAAAVIAHTRPEADALLLAELNRSEDDLHVIVDSHDFTLPGQYPLYADHWVMIDSYALSGTGNGKVVVAGYNYA